MKYRYYPTDISSPKREKLPYSVLRINYYGDFEDFEYDHDDSWQAKARRLQARRWRKITRGDV